MPIRLTIAPRHALLLALAAGLLAVGGGRHRWAHPAPFTVPAAQGWERVYPAMDSSANRETNEVTAAREVPPADAAPSESPIAAPQVDLSTEPDALREWAREDPPAAIRWLATAAPGEGRDAVLEIICAEIVPDDPAQAVGLAEAYSGGNLSLLENLVHAWAERDHPAALAHAGALPAGELQSRLLARVALAQGRTDPAAAATFVLAHIAQPELRDEALIAIVHRWAQHDAPAAAAWIERWPAGDLRTRVLGELH